MATHVLVIGVNGGIGRELMTQLLTINTSIVLHTVSRSGLAALAENHHHYQLDSSNDKAVAEFVDTLKQQRITVSQVICTTGVLHTSGEKSLKPEKRLEDINPSQLTEYFAINTIIPAIWLKYLVKIVSKELASIVFFSARVGSISENELGGWYGYRASKAALNMLVKTASVEYKRRAPNTILACYHPGTVDTDLSRPFQKNVKPGKLFTPSFTVQQLLQHIKNFEVEHSPYYIDWDGKTIRY